MQRLNQRGDHVRSCEGFGWRPHDGGAAHTGAGVLLTRNGHATGLWMSVLGGETEIRQLGRDVDFWQKTDVPTYHGDVGYQGMNGLGSNAAEGPFKTRNALWPPPALPAVWPWKPRRVSPERVE